MKIQIPKILFLGISFTSQASCWAANEADFIKDGEPAQRAPHFFSPNAQESILTFDHKIHYRHKKSPTAAEANTQIEKTVKHLFGPLAAARFPGAPKENHQITDVHVSGKSGDFIIHYHYTGTVLLHTGVASLYPVILPVDPERVFQAGVILSKNGKKQRPCTDATYSSETDFWYFWNPYKKGCRLQEKIDFDVVSAHVTLQENTQQTYPEYNRLVNSEGVIRISLILGPNDRKEKNLNPLESTDEGAKNFQAIRRDLKKMGFSLPAPTNQDTVTQIPPEASENATVEVYERKTHRATIQVQLFFGSTSISEGSRPFHYFLKDAIEHSSIVIYNGHSGLGGNLDLASIEAAENFKIQPDPDRYQIFFFNGCTSYAYYTSTFFDFKATEKDPKGTQNLDILVNGLETYFNDMHPASMALIAATQSWGNHRNAPSYQDLAKQIDKNSLLSVVGDEDNPEELP